jgi:endonuclease V-like protein UPF0215 family|tara:strand:+ start:161 stop:421 length:261 start_codon:yes stop_codon:yes gene_type:complete
MPNSKDIDKALNEKFVSKEKFTEEIEKFVLETKMNYIDAIVEYCDRKGIELETAGKLVTKPLKEKIKYEAQQLNFMKKTSRGKLPL